MPEKNIKEDLEKELRRLYDDNDNVLGVMTISGKENWSRILGFIQKAEELGDDITCDDISKLALIMKKSVTK